MDNNESILNTNEDVEQEIAEAEKRLTDLKAKKAAQIEAAKQAKIAARKAEAVPVQEAIDAYEAAKVACNEAIKAAYDTYQQSVQEAERALAEKQAPADKLLNEFLAKHPEGFHYTYKSPDGKITRAYDYYNQRYTVWDDFRRIEAMFKDIFGTSF